LKQEPPKPTEACKNFSPILLSIPMTFDNPLTSTPVTSHNSEIELMEKTRCAKKAFAVSFENSEDHTLFLKISFGLYQYAYIYLLKIVLPFFH
jgi:hypothetical protein